METPFQSINDIPISSEAKHIIAKFITDLYATGVDVDWYDEITANSLKELCTLHNDVSGLLLQKKNAETYEHFLEHESDKKYKMLNQIGIS